MWPSGRSPGLAVFSKYDYDNAAGNTALLANIAELAHGLGTMYFSFAPGFAIDEPADREGHRQSRVLRNQLD
jgi:hypothetical protein